MKFSIIVPYFNSDKFIDRCLSSLMCQSFKDFNVIIVDDCSSKESYNKLLNIVKEYKDDRILVIQNEKNLGPSLSRKNGIMQSTSEYVCFCDSDDEYQKNYLESIYQSSNNGSNDIIFCSYNIKYSNGHIIKKDLVSNLIDKNKYFLIAAGSDSLCCISFKRTLFNNIEFPNLRHGEDMCIIPLLISKANKYGFVNEYLYNYIYRKESLSKNCSLNTIMDLSLSFKYIEENIPNIYKEEIEFLGIRNYLYGFFLNLFKIKFDKKMIIELMKNFYIKYPNWKKNKYFYLLPRYKKIFLYLLDKKLYLICFIFSKLHKIISR